MKRTKKIISLVLAVLISAGSLLLPAYAAADADDPYARFREGTGYVAIGDSFTRGYGASDHWQDQIYLNDDYGNFDCRNVDDSYPDRLAKAFGLNTPNDIRDTSATLWPLAHDAVSTAYMLDLLGIDDGFRDDEFTYQDGSMLGRYETDLRYFGDPLSYTLDGTARYGETGEVMSVRELINNASFITLGVGQTDVIYKAQIFGLNTLDLSDTKKLPAGIANIIKLLKQYFDYWKKAYPLLLDYIKENNPDAKVVLVGTMNPIKHATMTDDFALQIGSAIDIIFDLMNLYTKDCALKYGYTFVDISDVETPSSATRMSIGHILSLSDPIEYALIAHPTPKGYSQIADKILKAVNKDLKREQSKFLGAVRDLFNKISDLFKRIGLRFSYLFKMNELNALV